MNKKQIYQFETEEDAKNAFDYAVEYVEREFFMESTVCQLEGKMLHLPEWFPISPPNAVRIDE